MLLREQKKIKFENAYQKILHISPAYKGTVCLLGIKGHRKDCLSHVDEEGKIINEIIFSENIDSFAMLSQTEVIVLETRKNNILIWNLEKNVIYKILFVFQTPETDQSQIFLFPETHLICIQQNGRYKNDKFKLTYYKYPLKEDQQPIIQYNDDSVWTYQYLVRKANNHSMICWFKGRHDDGFQFRTFDLRDDQKGKYSSFKFANEIHKFIPNAPKAQVALTTMWQMAPHKFMLVCISTLSNHATQAQKVNNNFVYNTIDNTLRPSLFSLGKYGDLHLDQHNFGSICMFRTFDFKDGKPLQTPIFYVSNKTQEIIAQQTWKCSYIYKYEFNNFKQDEYIQCLFQNGNVTQATIITKKFSNAPINQLSTKQKLLSQN